MAQSAAVSVGSGSGLAGTSVTLPIAFTPGATAVSSIQFDLVFSYPLSYRQMTAGAAAVAAPKDVSANPFAAGVHVLVFRMNTTTIGPGEIAYIQLAIAAGAPAGMASVGIANIVASDPNAFSVAITGTNGGVQVLASADTTAPVISAVSSYGITTSGATIMWATNEPADGQVEYGTSTSYGSSTALDGTRTNSHLQNLAGLAAGTLYHYRVKSRDAAGNLATSNDYTFSTTAVVDTTPPTITAVSSSGIKATGATINWMTNEAADGQVEYGTTATYGTSTALNSTRTTSHSQALTGLTAGTLYHYRVKSKDAAGNPAVSGDYTFTTASASDSMPPAISGVSSKSITSSSATIFWVTNEAADSQVVYGTTTTYGSTTPLDSTLTTSHSQTLKGLTADTLYHYRVRSADGAGNLTTSSDYTFTTKNRSAAPVISEIKISGVTDKSATITWTTDEPSDSELEFWSATQPVRKSGLGDLVTNHSLTLNRLQKLMEYRFLLKSTDSEGNQAVTPELTFRTGARGPSAVALPLFASASGAQQSPALGEDIMVGMGLSNVGFDAATLTFTAVDSSGNLITGPDIVNPKTHELGPGMQLAMLDLSIFGDGITRSNSNGWIKLESTSSDVGGFFLTFDAGMSIMDGASFGDAPLKNVVFTEIEPAGSTKIDIVNSNPEDASVTFSVMKADGTTRGSQSRVIGGNGALFADLYQDLFDGIQPDPTDYVLMKSTKNVETFELMQKRTGDIATLAGQDLTAGGTVLYSPQYVVGGPWRTGISIVNLDSKPGEATLQLFSEYGMPIGAPQTIVLAANGKIQIDDPAYFGALEGGVIVEGYVKIVSDGIRLVGSTVFRGLTGVPLSSALPLIYNLQNSMVFSHMVSNDRYWTGLALLNPNASDANLTIEIHGSDGALIDGSSLLIPAHQRSTCLLTEYFPSLIGKNPSGDVRVISNKPLASFSLFGTNNLSVMSAIPAQ